MNTIEDVYTLAVECEGLSKAQLAKTREIIKATTTASLRSTNETLAIQSQERKCCSPKVCEHINNMIAEEIRLRKKGDHARQQT